MAVQLKHTMVHAYDKLDQILTVERTPRPRA